MTIKYHDDRTLPSLSSDCGSTITALSGVLTSPNYPDNYDNGIDSCVFIISQPAGSTINLQVDDLRIEAGPSPTCPFDSVEIRDGNSESSSLIGKFCNNNRPPNSMILSSQNHLWIRLEFNDFKLVQH